MTIIQPAKNKIRISFIILLIIIFLMAGVYIYGYNRVVSLSYRISSLEKAISNYQNLNSDLKSQYYQLTDPARLEELAKENGLIMDQRPQYLGANF